MSSIQSVTLGVIISLSGRVGRADKNLGHQINVSKILCVIFSSFGLIIRCRFQILNLFFKARDSKIAIQKPIEKRRKKRFCTFSAQRPNIRAGIVRVAAESNGGVLLETRRPPDTLFSHSRTNICLQVAEVSVTYWIVLGTR